MSKKDISIYLNVIEKEDYDSSKKYIEKFLDSSEPSSHSIELFKLHNNIIESLENTAKLRSERVAMEKISKIGEFFIKSLEQLEENDDVEKKLLNDAKKYLDFSKKYSSDSETRPLQAFEILKEINFESNGVKEIINDSPEKYLR